MAAAEAEARTPYEDWEGRYDHLDKFFLRPGPMAVDGFVPCEELKNFILNDIRVLVIGAGGLGCELLKDMALMGFRNMDVIDMDTIDLSNLNRQFLFREDDIGKSKAECAARFVMNRVPGVTITPYHGKIQDKNEAYYSQFSLVVCGLDSIDARRWINAMLVGICKTDNDGNVDPTTVIPMIDGGTEGLKGQARVIFPRMTSCFECALDTFPPQVAFPWCTIASNPRKPEHCVIYIKEKLWEENWDRPLDADSIEDVQWCQEAAQARADEYNINSTITFQFCQGVLKNIIPAVASSNALISAVCAQEAFKIATNCNGNLNNWLMFTGDTGLYTFTFPYERKENCPVCGSASATIERQAASTLADLREFLEEDGQFQLKGTGLTTMVDGKKKTLFLPGVMANITKGNLEKQLDELFPSGSVLVVTAASLPSTHWEITVNFM